MKLLKIVTSATQTAFQVKIKDNDIRVFFTNTEQSDKFEPIEKDIGKIAAEVKYNKNCLYKNIKNIKDKIYKVYYNMYDSKMPFYKSAIYKVGKSSRTGSTYDFLDITNHKLSTELMNLVQVDNTIYAIEPKSQYGRYNLSCDIWSWISADHTFTLPPNTNIETVVYDKDYINDCISNNLSINPDSAIKDRYDKIQYNMLYEINGNIYNDYESGNIATNTFKGKNQFDCVYDMNHDNTAVLSNARDYIDIDKCCNLIYLKYYDTVDYRWKDPEHSDYEIHDVRDDNDYIGNKFGFKYLNIEIIKTINRFEKFDGHKSNLYSIVVNTDILDEIRHKNITNRNVEILINNIIAEMKNCIRAIAESIQPAHTALYKVYVNGK